MAFYGSGQLDTESAYLVSKLFKISFVMGRYRRRFKAWNGGVYRLTKGVLILGALALVIYV